MFPVFDFTTFDLAFGKSLLILVLVPFALTLGKMLLAGLLAPAVGSFRAAEMVANVTLMAGAFLLLAWAMGPGQGPLAAKVQTLVGDLLSPVTAPFTEIARALDAAH